MRMSDKKTQVTIRLEKSIADQLSARAEQQRLSRSGLAARIVQAAFEADAAPAGPQPPTESNESLERMEGLLRQLVVATEAANAAIAAPPEHAIARILADSETLRELAENLPHTHQEIFSHQTQQEQELKRLRIDLAKAVAVILVSGGKADPDTARAWVDRHLLQPPVRSTIALRTE